MAFSDGAKMVRVIGGPVSFYENYQTTTLYVPRAFSGNVNTITVSNDSATDTVTLSYDGATVDGSLEHGESITLNTTELSSIYIRATVGGDYVRIWGW
jgi:hypothetical protein